MWRPARELRTLRGDPEVKRLIGLLRKGNHEAARTLAVYPIESCADLASVCSSISKSPQWEGDRQHLLEGFANKALGAKPRSLCIIGNSLARHRIPVDIMHGVLSRLTLSGLNAVDIQMLAVYCGTFPRDFNAALFWERMVTFPLSTLSPVALATVVQSIVRTKRALPWWNGNADFISRLKTHCMSNLGAMEPRHLCSLMADLLFLDILDAESVVLIEREARRQQRSFQPRDVVQFAKTCAKVPKSMRITQKPHHIAPHLFSRCEPVDLTEVLRLWTTQGWQNIELSGELLNRWRDRFCRVLPKLSSERLAFVTKDIAKRPNAPRIVTALLEPTLKRVDIDQLSLDGVVAASRGVAIASGDLRLKLPYLLEQRLLAGLSRDTPPHLLPDAIDSFAALSHTPQNLLSAFVRTASAMAPIFAPKQISRLAKSMQNVQLQLPPSVASKAANLLHRDPTSWSAHDLVCLVSSTDDKRVIEKAEKMVQKGGHVPQKLVVALAHAFGPAKVWRRLRPDVLEFNTLCELADLHVDVRELDELSMYLTEKAESATFDDAAAVAHLWAQRERRDEALFAALEPVLCTGLCYRAFYALAKLGVAPKAQRAMALELQSTDVEELSDADAVRVAVALGTLPVEHKETLQRVMVSLVSRNPAGWHKSIQFAGAMAKNLFSIDDSCVPPEARGPRVPASYPLEGVEKSVAACFGPVEQYHHPPFSLRLCVPDSNTIFDVLQPEDFFGDTHLKPFTFQRLKCLEKMGYKVAVVDAQAWPDRHSAQRNYLQHARKIAE